IRDRNVTGVQTCALPIWHLRMSRRHVKSRRQQASARGTVGSGSVFRFDVQVVTRMSRFFAAGTYVDADVRFVRPFVVAEPYVARSEERRVGEEGGTARGR